MEDNMLLSILSISSMGAFIPTVMVNPVGMIEAVPT